MITRILHVFLHETFVKVINSLYTLFDVITFCNLSLQAKGRYINIKGIESREKYRVKTCFVCFCLNYETGVLWLANHLGISLNNEFGYSKPL